MSAIATRLMDSDTRYSEARAALSVIVLPAADWSTKYWLLSAARKAARRSVSSNAAGQGDPVPVGKALGITNRVRPSSPPSVQAKAPWSGRPDPALALATGDVQADRMPSSGPAGARRRPPRPSAV